MAKRRWKDLTPKQQATVLTLGAIQLSLAATAWTDLAKRPAEQVHGPKWVWAAVIAVNWVGPLAYFWKGRSREA